MNKARVHTLLFTLALCASGCAGPQMAFTREAEDSDPFPAEIQLARRPTLAVKPCRSPHRMLHKRIVRSLDESGQFADVFELERGRFDEAQADYVLELSYQTEGSGKFYNLFTCFPGFVFFLPNLVKLRWDYDLVTQLRLAPQGREAQLLKRHDRYHLAYTSDGYSICNNLGWSCLLFTPMAALPLGAGIASIFDSPDMERVQDAFSGSAEGYQFGEGVVRWVVQAIQPLEASRVAPAAASGR